MKGQRQSHTIMWEITGSLIVFSSQLLDFQAIVENDEIARYRVNVKISFIVK